MQDCARGLPISRAPGGPSHFPLALGSPLPGRWRCLAACKPDPGVQGKTDRNAPLGEDLAFLWSMPARSTVPCACAGQTHHYWRVSEQTLLTSAGQETVCRDGLWRYFLSPLEMKRADNTHTPFSERHTSLWNHCLGHGVRKCFQRRKKKLGWKCNIWNAVVSWEEL